MEAFLNKPAIHSAAPDVHAKVNVRASARDDYAGLRGHDYIKARNLNPPVQRVHTSAHAEPESSAQVRK